MDGSIRDARRAGAQLATTATPPSNSATPTYVSGSTRETPNNSDSSNRLAATAPAMPIVTPATTSSIPRPTTCRTMLADVAPSAVRMPISRTRSATPPEMTPYRPTAASSRAATANASITTIRVRRDRGVRRRRDQRIHRRDLLDWLVGVDRPDRTLDVRRERRGVAGRSYHERPHVVRPPPLVRQHVERV